MLGRPGRRGSLRSGVPKELPQWSRPGAIRGATVGAGPSVLGRRNGLRAPNTLRCSAPLRRQRPRAPGRAGSQQSGRPPEAPDAKAGTRPSRHGQSDPVTTPPPPECPSHLWTRLLSHSAQQPDVTGTRHIRRTARADVSMVCLPTRTPRPGPGTRQASGGGEDWLGPNGGRMDRQMSH